MQAQSLAHETQARGERALELYRTRGHEIREIGPDLFEVPSQSGSGTYIVDYEAETCSCMDHEYYPGQSCKHLLAIGIYYVKRHRRVSVAGDPFVAAGKYASHACTDGWVYLGYTDDEGNEQIEALPCRRCAEDAR